MLALALEHAGLGLGGDDIVLINSSGQASSVPFAATVKAGAWRLAANYRTAATTARTFRRPDRKRVRYLPITKAISQSALPVVWLIFLRRRPGATASLAPLDPIEAMRQLIAGAFAPDRRLGAVGFDAMVHLLEAAECYELTYSQLDDAVQQVRELTRCRELPTL